MKNEIQPNQTYQLGKNILKVLKVEGDKVQVLINGVTIHDEWSKEEIQENITEGYLQLINQQ